MLWVPTHCFIRSIFLNVPIQVQELTQMFAVSGSGCSTDSDFLVVQAEVLSGFFSQFNYLVLVSVPVLGFSVCSYTLFCSWYFL